MWEKVVEKTPCLLWFVPDCFRTKKMCEKVVGERLGLLRDVTDWIITQQQLNIWCDGDNHRNDDERIKWYKRYQKRRAQKASIKEQILSFAWDPERYWDWCMSEDEKQGTENYGHKYRFLSIKFDHYLRTINKHDRLDSNNP